MFIRPDPWLKLEMHVKEKLISCTWQKLKKSKLDTDSTYKALN